MPGGKRALDDVSFDVPRGQIFGLLGPNGAGKSTLINILAGLVVKTSGKAIIWGFDIDEHPRNAKRSIGIVPQEILFDPFFTPREALEIQAGLYGIPREQRSSDELLAAMHLTDKADAYSRTLSGGMKRRLLVAKAMVHSPPILVLDEPTAGVDIELRRQLWDYVRELNAQGGHGRADHALSRRSGGAVRPHRDHPPRPGDCQRTDARPRGQGAGEGGRRDLRSRHRRPVPTNACFENIRLLDERTLEITFRKDKVNAGEVLAAVSATVWRSSTCRPASPTSRTCSSAWSATRRHERMTADVLIVGSGAAGLTAALNLAEDRKVAVIAKGALGEGATGWAQGGIAAVLEEGRQLRSACQRHDDRRRRAQRPAVVEHVVEVRARAIQRLIELGVPFAEEGGALHLTREGGHSHRRIVHVADATG